MLMVLRNDTWSSEAYDPDDGTSGASAGDLHGIGRIVAVFPREGSKATDKDFCAALGLAEWGSD